MNSDGFVLVTKRKRAKAKTGKLSTSEPTLPQESVESCIKKVLEAKEELLQGAGYEQLEADLKEIESNLSNVTEIIQSISSIVCYGLGLPSYSRIARYQAGLLILLRDYFNVKVEVYDPAFSNIDIEALKSLQFSVLEQNEEGKRRVNKPTVFYMPHCGKELYNNLLWANWNYEHLSKCIIIGNSFRLIVQNVPQRILRKSFGYIHQAADYFTEYPLKHLVKEENIFNDMSIHVIGKNGNDMSNNNDFWSVGIEPVYECNAEFIKLS